MSDRKPLSEVLDDLKKEYILSFPKKLEKIEKLTAEKNWKELADEYHKLKGTGKTYGFPQISTLCEKMELMANQSSTQQRPLFESGFTVLKKLLTAYQQNSSFSIHEDPLFLMLNEIKTEKK